MQAIRFIENLERFDSDASDEEEPRLRIIREGANYFESFAEQDFFRMSNSRFRMRKLTVLKVLQVLQLIEYEIEFLTDRNDSLTPMNQLLLTLRFYATGNFLLKVGDFAGVSASTSCRVVKKVTTALANLRQQFIKFPTTNEEKTVAKNKFYLIAGFPNVVGTIDCTHVKILNPGGNDAEIFKNRKGYFSFNVQTILSANLKVVDIVARWPRSTHDSVIFQNSRICYEFETGSHKNCFLIGDNRYALKNYLLTPYLNPATVGQVNYNQSHISTRNTVERQYGLMKRRLPALALGLRLKLETALSVVLACAILHNICIDEKEDQPPNEVNNVDNLIEDEQINLENLDNRRYGYMRDLIVHNFFDN